MTTYSETARQLADKMSSYLSDEDRATAIRNAAPIARLLLDACKDRDSACMLAVSVARIMSTLSLTRVSEIAASLDTLNTAYAFAGGMASGHLAIPDYEPAEESAPSLSGPYL